MKFLKKQIIFYGPPGTGKTYHIQEQTLNYLDTNTMDVIISSEERTLIQGWFNQFYNHNSFLLKDNAYKPGKKNYRNLRGLNLLMHYFVYKNSNSISKQDIISTFEWDGPSSYVQQVRILTNFDLIDDSKITDYRKRNLLDRVEFLTLNKNGLALKEQYASLNNSNTVIKQKLKNKNQRIKENKLEDFAIDYLINCLENTTIETMSLYKNMIFASLRLVIENGKFIDYSASHKPSKDELELLDKCLNYGYDDGLKWFKTYLLDLKLINPDTLELTNLGLELLKNTYLFNQFRTNEISSIVAENDTKYSVSTTNKYFAKRELLNIRRNQNKIFEMYKQKKQINIITFHPSFEYEDFLEGITVQTKQDGTLNYYYKTGVLKSFCYEALKNCLLKNEILSESEILDWNSCINYYLKNKNKITWEKADNFIFIIDELNRGDVAKIFGETISLIEDDKRIGEVNELTVTLPYTQEVFGIPKNIIFLTTMNTSDKSIGAIDIAIRRRFDLQPLDPDFNIVKEYYYVHSNEEPENSLLYKSADALTNLNDYLIKIPYIGRGKLIGHALLMGTIEMNDSDIINIWKYNIFPLLEEYFVGDFNTLNRILKINDETLFDSYKGFKAEKYEEIEKIITTLVESNAND